jgi:hypothetical protein
MRLERGMELGFLVKDLPILDIYSRRVALTPKYLRRTKWLFAVLGKLLLMQ